MKTEIEITEEIVRELNAEERAAARAMLAALCLAQVRIEAYPVQGSVLAAVKAAIAQAEAAGIGEE